MSRKFIVPLTALTLAASLAACKVNPAPGGGSPSTAQAGPADTCGGYSWCTTAPAPAVPSQQHSMPPAAPPTFPKVTDEQLKELQELQAVFLGQCKMYMSPSSRNGITVAANGYMQGQLVIKCIVSPTQQTLAVSLEWRNPSTGRWEIKGGTASGNPPVGGNVDNVYNSIAPANSCVKGAWSMLIFITGIGYDGHTQFYTQPTGVRTPTRLVSDCSTPDEG